MADFCRECSILMFGKDFRELADTPPEWEGQVICEACGVIRVDSEGRCLLHTREQHERMVMGEQHAILVVEQGDHT